VNFDSRLYPPRYRTLVCHRAAPASEIDRVNVVISRAGNALWITYVVEGDTALLALPEPQKPCRTDGLWQSTCFELFARCSDGTYLEFNFSPSEQWAAYLFSSYRDGMEPWPVDMPPSISACDEGYALVVSVTLDVPTEATMFGLSAVIVEKNGTKSYWALAHPPSGPPDFHDPACFKLELPPASPQSSPRT